MQSHLTRRPWFRESKSRGRAPEARGGYGPAYLQLESTGSTAGCGQRIGCELGADGEGKMLAAGQLISAKVIA